MPPLKRKLQSSQIWSQTAPDVDLYTARIDSGHTDKQSGPAFGLYGALHLELRDTAPPAGRSRVDNWLCQSRYEQRNLSQIGYNASIVTKVRPSCRSVARSALSGNSVNEVVGRRPQTAVKGRFWLQRLDLMGFAIYSVAFYGRFAS